MTENTENISPEEEVEQVEPEPNTEETEVTEEAEDTFPRSYVEKLRDESAKYRQRAQQTDTLAQRLHTALVEATGALQDATDLEYDEKHLDDPEALQQAIDELIKAKPHLAARRPRGDVGQGHTGSSNPVDLAGILRSRA